MTTSAIAPAEDVAWCPCGWNGAVSKLVGEIDKPASDETPAPAAQTGDEGKNVADPAGVVPGKMTKEQLSEALTAAGIEHDPKAKKEALLELFLEGIQKKEPEADPAGQTGPDESGVNTPDGPASSENQVPGTV